MAGFRPSAPRTVAPLAMLGLSMSAGHVWSRPCCAPCAKHAVLGSWRATLSSRAARIGADGTACRKRDIVLEPVPASAVRAVCDLEFCGGVDDPWAK